MSPPGDYTCSRFPGAMARMDGPVTGRYAATYNQRRTTKGLRQTLSEGRP